MKFPIFIEYMICEKLQLQKKNVPNNFTLRAKENIFIECLVRELKLSLALLKASQILR